MNAHRLVMTASAAAAVGAILAGCGSSANSPSSPATTTPTTTLSTAAAPTSSAGPTTTEPSVINGFTVPNLPTIHSSAVNPPLSDTDLKFTVDLAQAQNSTYFDAAKYDLVALGHQVCTDLAKLGGTREEAEQQLPFGSPDARQEFVALAQQDLCP